MDTLSTSEFVAIFPNAKSVGAKLLERVRSAVQISPLPGAPNGFLVTLPKPASSAKSGWKLLNQLFEGKSAIYPVFRDQDNVSHYALGKVQVRFQTPPTVQELIELCKERGLKSAERNQFAPTQVSFELRDPQSQFLPDLVKEVQTRSKDQVQVWPETLTAFQRSV